MDYLLFLNKFELNQEKLKSKIKIIDKTASFQDFEQGFLLHSSLDAKELTSFQEISKIALLFTDWKEFGFKTLKSDALALCNHYKLKDYFIDVKFYDKVKISVTSLYKYINPYLKFEHILVNEKSEHFLYLELKKFDDVLKYRFAYAPRSLWCRNSALSIDLSNFSVVLENPTLVSEVSDFLRLCWIFKLSLFILTQDKLGFEKILKKAKEETKGIDYEKFELKIVNKLPSDFTLVGFSKHALLNEKDLKPILLTPKKIAFVFGDDKYGLTQETRDKLDTCFRLTPETKKPLRASHALSYVLGFSTAFKL